MNYIELAIVALLPITALFTVIQRRPYFALISRGIMGVAATLIYALLGAPDVALTEALIGTLLTILLYAIAVRSSMVLRFGWVADFGVEPDGPACSPMFEPVRLFCAHHELALRYLYFDDWESLLDALQKGAIDAVYGPAGLVAEKTSHLTFVEPPRDAAHAVCLARHGDSIGKKMKSFFAEAELFVCTLGGSARTSGLHHAGPSGISQPSRGTGFWHSLE